MEAASGPEAPQHPKWYAAVSHSRHRRAHEGAASRKCGETMFHCAKVLLISFLQFIHKPTHYLLHHMYCDDGRRQDKACSVTLATHAPLVSLPDPRQRHRRRVHTASRHFAASRRYKSCPSHRVFSVSSLALVRNHHGWVISNRFRDGRVRFPTGLRACVGPDWRDLA